MTHMPLNLPNRRMEAWKWTDVSKATASKPAGMSDVATLDLSVPDGVTLSKGEGHAGDTLMSALAVEVASESHQVYVPANWSGEALTLHPVSAGHARVAIMVDKGASLTLVETYDEASAGFSNIDINIHLAEGASLTRIILQNDTAETVRVATACIATESATTLDQFALSFGSALTRLETRLFGEGREIVANLNGAYLLSDKRHCDMTSFIKLSDESAVIRQAVKGVVTDKARGVFQGKFHVEQAAQHTDAEMRHDALMFSETSEIRSKPELEIYADDVACAHGNTIGTLDESALFYMRQRGIPEGQARALLTEAFLAEVFDDLDNEALRETMLEQVRTWLEEQS